MAWRLIKHRDNFTCYLYRLSGVFLGFSQFLQVNSGMMPWKSPGHPLSKTKHLSLSVSHLTLRSFASSVETVSLNSLSTSPLIPLLVLTLFAFVSLSLSLLLPRPRPDTFTSYGIKGHICFVINGQNYGVVASGRVDPSADRSAELFGIKLTVSGVSQYDRVFEVYWSTQLLA